MRKSAIRFVLSALLLLSGAVVPNVMAQCDYTAQWIAPGQPITGNVAGIQTIYYRFDVSAPGTYSIYTSGGADTFGQLLDANCQVIAENDDGGAAYGYNFNIERQLSPGTYYISVRGYNQSVSGPFTLHIEVGGGQAGGVDCSSAQDIPFGGSVDGVLNGTTPIYYRIISPGGQARVYTTGNLDTVGQALDANCNVLAENDDGGGDYGYNFMLEGEVPAGTYYISVRGYSDNDRGPFTLYVEGGDGGQAGGSDCTNAMPLSVGGTVSGTVQGLTTQYYSFRVATPGAYRIYTDGDTDTYGQLLDAGCTVLTENDDSGQDFNFMIEQQLAPGTHYISVRGYSADITGMFTLHIESTGAGQGPSDCSNALALTVGGSASGMAQGQTLQYYSFQVASAGTYSIYTSGDTDTVGMLLDVNCQMLTENDDGGGAYGYNFHIEQYLDIPGTYYVAVGGYGETTGPYTLHIEGAGGQEVGSNCDNAYPVAVGGSVSEMAQGRTLQYYSFQVASAGTYSIYTSGDTDTVGLLSDPNCQMLTENDDGGDYGYNFHIEQYLNIPGTYYVAVGGYDENTRGFYTLHIEIVDGDGGQAAGSNCDNALPLTVGGPVSGMAQGQTQQYYSFQVASAGTYSIYTSGDTDTIGLLVDPNCQMLTENDDGGGAYGYNFHIEEYLDIPGTYYVAVGGYGQTTGPYTLHIESAGGPGPSDCTSAADITVGFELGGAVQGMTPQFYRFRVDSSATYQIFTTGSVDTVGQLLDPNCQVLAENDDGGGSYGYNFLIEQALQPGIYYVSVRGYSASITGEFGLNVTTTTGGKPDTGGAAEAEVRQAMEQFFQAMRNFDIDSVIGMSTGEARQYFEGYRQHLMDDPRYRDSERQLATTLQWVIEDISFDSTGNVATANVTITLGGATLPAAIDLQRESGTWKVSSGLAP